MNRLGAVPAEAAGTVPIDVLKVPDRTVLGRTLRPGFPGKEEIREEPIIPEHVVELILTRIFLGRKPAVTEGRIKRIEEAYGILNRIDHNRGVRLILTGGDITLERTCADKSHFHSVSLGILNDDEDMQAALIGDDLHFWRLELFF